ncbi:MAG: ethanolamine ammonia-lyase subunit EutC [Methylobacteriaceae bacterium]|nr:ethanolamine ammonia-lyase subunit EutC [Methylobacteriaceae bacterium]
MEPEAAWARLRRLTPARIALGRAGHALPTREVLAFALAHARARDAVAAAADLGALEAALAGYGLAAVTVESAAPDRPTYLARPDLGRRLSDVSRARLAGLPPAPGALALVVADGLSAPALAHAPALVAALRERLGQRLRSPVVLARQARVALGDEVGEVLGAEAVLILLGERPGLSAPDSLGAYLTFGPRPGRTDAERNCVSNIRPGGLPPDEAAYRIAWLVEAALTRRLTGVALKDASDEPARLATPPGAR